MRPIDVITGQYYWACVARDCVVCFGLPPETCTRRAALYIIYVSHRLCTCRFICTPNTCANTTCSTRRWCLRKKHLLFCGRVPSCTHDEFVCVCVPPFNGMKYMTAFHILLRRASEGFRALLANRLFVLASCRAHSLVPRRVSFQSTPFSSSSPTSSISINRCDSSCVAPASKRRQLQHQRPKMLCVIHVLCPTTSYIRLISRVPDYRNFTDF